MSKPKGKNLVSIVVASYNHANFLVRRMDSLIAQTYSNIEILVIDDKSSDHSVEILRKYRANPLIRLVFKDKNTGWVAVSNQGINMSSGEYILFANCDDDCEPEMVERLVNALQQYPSAGIAFCRSMMVDQHNHVIGDDFKIREPRFRKRCELDTLLSGSEMSRFLLHSCVAPNLSAVLFRRECFEQVGKLSNKYQVCCDWELFFRISEKYDVAYVSEALNRFRQHQKTIRNVTKEKIVYEEYFQLLLGKIQDLSLSFVERSRFRTHVMYLWIIHLVSLSLTGVLNFPYHLRCILKIDPLAIIFFIPALILRAMKLVSTVFRKFS